MHVCMVKNLIIQLVFCSVIFVSHFLYMCVLVIHVGIEENIFIQVDIYMYKTNNSMSYQP